ncbi:MAG: copper oxidase [Pirellulaceae bacterium]|nr:copper oxidase [Pirellulaceae bacterium]
MTDLEQRRKFLLGGVAATSGMLSARSLSSQEKKDDHAGHGGIKMPQSADAAGNSNDGEMPKEMTVEAEYPRTQPGLGGPVGSPTDRGKMVPGYRDATLPPVPIHAPDLKKLPWKEVNGAKEFHLVAETVRRELLPGVWMDTFGYNGDMPGPTIELNQGDRIRIVLHNKLPEPTTLHLHGLELPNDMDGVPYLNQDPIEPGQEFAYEWTVHQEGTFFYHSHEGMQEAMGMLGLFIVYPAKTHEPAVDRDFVLIAQGFQLRPNSTVPDTLSMEWNFLSFNGRSGPLTTPLLCKLGERVRIRFLDFSVMDHHPLHLHGHTFWITGTEGGRLPESAWYPSNNVLVAVAQVREVEFIANNPGDWGLHCHMFHHMMNSMSSQAGPMIRDNSTPEQLKVRGYPQVMLGMKMPKMKGMEMPGMDKKGTDMPGMDMKDMPQPKPPLKPNGEPDHSKMNMQPETAQKPKADHKGMEGMEGTDRVEGRREAMGMRTGWSMGIEGLFTVLRVLPTESYDKIMGSQEHEGHTKQP